MRTKLAYQQSEETAHLWANGCTDPIYSRCLRTSARGGNYYSYRTTIAKWVDGVAVVSTETYSSTTTKHQREVRSALHGRDYIKVPNVNYSTDENIEELKKQAQFLANKQKRARARDYMPKIHSLIETRLNSPDSTASKNAGLMSLKRWRVRRFWPHS